ncbi:MAG TPA: bile acid:sodium symporter family protein, partial [Thermodesulfobacteriota bacterium]|nr:bile acid:sodium symporter family protein [Thermodesulfobacteriota bacterium]
VAAQFLIMPALALVIARLLKLEPSLALGLILVGAVPDAMASGVISYLAQADVAFSVALTSATTLVAPLVTPSVTYLFGKMYIPIQFWPLFLSIIKMVIVPLAAGLAVKHRWGKEIAPVEKLFPTLSTLFIAFICGLVVALNKEHLAEVSPSIITGVFLLNLFGLIFGYATGKLFRFDIKRSRTLAINVAMQNAGLGAVLALKHFSAEAAIPNALFATWCIVTGSILAAWWTRKSRQLPQEH